MKKIAIIATLAFAALGMVNAADALESYPGYYLQMGVPGPDANVMTLQNCLMGEGYENVGGADGYFGYLTRGQVMTYQAAMELKIDGIVGPQTWGDLDCEVDEDMDDEDMDDEDMDDDADAFDSHDGEEASLEDYSLDSEDDAEEGDMTHVATIEFDVEDGDAMIERLDLAFFPSATPTEDEPWDSFDTLTLMVDGDEIAEVDIDDEDDWLEDDYTDASADGLYVGGTDAGYEFRVNGLDYIVDKGDKAEIEVYLTSASSVDDAGSDADWIIYVDDEGIRAIDTAGITQYTGDNSDEVTFSIDAEGGDESIEINSSTDDPESASLQVDDSEDSDWFEVFVFELESEENDIDIDTLNLTVNTGAADYDDVVNDITVEIDGEEFDDVTVVDGDSTSADLAFDIDKDATIDADDTVDVVVMIEFKKADGVLYSPGETIQVDTVSVDGEGVDDVSDTTTVSSETHTLTLADITVNVTEESASTNDDDSVGYISFTFTVEAEGDDVTFDVTDNADVDGAADDVMFTLTGTDTSIATAAIANTDGDASYAGSTWTIAEGETATFVLDTTFTTVDAGDNGTYRVNLDTVAGIEVDDLSAPVNLSF